ncbi:MAG: hypothetical protein IJI23_00340 [Lachnospiraceae bacterium]|nr:hypothetical protein [Lachnospiraceae bacterium]
MYIYKQYKYPSVILHDFYFNGNYGAKGEKRQPKREFTPEQIKKHNQRQKEKEVQLLLLENFKKGDYWITLTYPKGIGTEIGISQVRDDLSVFIGHLRKVYRKKGYPLKWMRRIEVGSGGAKHVHLTINRIPDTDIMELTSEYWESKHGHADHRSLNNEDPTFAKLAEYMTKPPSEAAVKKLKAIGDSDDISSIVNYSRSRNLKKPVPEVRKYTRRKMNRILDGEIKPTDGYYIDRDRKPPVRGINPYNGMSYLSYREIRLEKGIEPEPVKFCECPICHQFTLDFVKCDCQLKKKRNGYKHLHTKLNKTSTTGSS